MEILKEVIVRLSIEDIEKILKEHLEKNLNISIKSVFFDINKHEIDGDWSSSMPTISKLDSIICKGNYIKN